MYQTPYAFIYYNFVSSHLVTRHPWTSEFAGYSAPLTQTSWLMYITTGVILSTIIILALNILRPFAWTSYWLQLPFLVLGCLLHHDQYSHLKIIGKFKGGQWLVLLTALVAFFFSLMYYQDFVSSLANIQLETLPNSFQDIDTRIQYVTQFESVPHFRVNRYFNYKILGTYNETKFPNNHIWRSLVC